MSYIKFKYEFLSSTVPKKYRVAYLEQQFPAAFTECQGKERLSDKVVRDRSRDREHLSNFDLDLLSLNLTDVGLPRNN